MTGMNKLMYLIMFVTVCIFVLLLPLMDYIPRNSWAVKLSDVPVFAPPPSQEKTRIIFTSRVAETAKQESDLESHIRVPITWTKEQTMVNILTVRMPALTTSEAITVRLICTHLVIWMDTPP